MLEKELLKPLEDFFKELDKMLEIDYFSKKLEETKNRVSGLELILKNRDGEPIINTQVVIKSLQPAKERTILPLPFYRYLSTNGEGRINVLLPKGKYIIEVPDYRYIEEIELENPLKLIRELGRKIKIKIQYPHPRRFKNKYISGSIVKESYISGNILSQVKLLLSIFLPFLISLGIMYWLLKLEIIHGQFQNDVGLNAIILLFFSSSFLPSFILWLGGGILAGIISNKIRAPLASMLTLSWVTFLFALNESPIDIETLINQYYWVSSLPIMVIINTITMVLTFTIGDVVGMVLRRKIFK